MEAETVDYIEWKTGTRVEGIMLSIMSFTGKIENTFFLLHWPRNSWSDRLCATR